MVRATRVLAKNRRPSGEERYVVTSSGSIVVNVKRLVSTEKAKKLATTIRSRRASGELRLPLLPFGVEE